VPPQSSRRIGCARWQTRASSRPTRAHARVTAFAIRPGWPPQPEEGSQPGGGDQSAQSFRAHPRGDRSGGDPAGPWASRQRRQKPGPPTQFFDDSTETILAYNDSPDVPFSYGVNPYRGCEHGCAYCYARAYHDYLGWSSGIDFETKIMVKRRAPELLRRELSSPKWQPQVIAFSGATDCYQPAERVFKLTRQCLDVLLELRNPVGVITKNLLVTRDVDLLAQFATWNGVMVNLTITTLDATLSGQLEPRAARPEARLRAIRTLADAGVPGGRDGGAGHSRSDGPRAAGDPRRRGQGRSVQRRLSGPATAHAVKDVFMSWLDTHVPSKKDGCCPASGRCAVVN
jgi:hypothetical protein